MSTDPSNRGGPLDPLRGIDELGLDAALRPRSLDEFIGQEEMPRTPTGKILHRRLREAYGSH